MNNPNFNKILANALAKQNKVTNADRIRSMADEELAEWIVRKTEGYGFDGYNESVKAWLKWLREENE